MYHREKKKIIYIYFFKDGIGLSIHVILNRVMLKLFHIVDEILFYFVEKMENHMYWMLIVRIWERI